MSNDRKRTISGLTLQDLFLKWPYGRLRIERIKIARHPGEHAKLFIRGILTEKDGRNVIHRASHKDEIGLWIHGSNGDADYPLFLGQMHQLELHEVQGNDIVEMTVISHTYQMDSEQKCRSFQQISMSYHEVIDEVLGAYPKQLYRADAFDVSVSLGRLLLQYEETDWEFLQRVASHAGAMLTPDVSQHKLCVWIGAPSGHRRIKLPEGKAYQIGRKLESFLTGIQTPRESWDEQAFTRCVVSLDQLLDLGDQVEIQGQSYTVMGLQGELVRGLFEFEYLCAIPEGVRQNQKFNPYLVGLAVEGKVIGVMPNRAKVHLDIDAEQDVGEAVWFPYSAPFSHLLHTMPQVGSRIKLFFPSHEEDDAMLINSVRTPMSSSGEAAQKADKKMADSTVKSFTTSYGKDFTLGTQDISFTAAEGTLYLSINDDTGIEMHSDKDIVWMNQELLEFSELKKFQVEAEQEIIVIGKGGSIILNDNTDAVGKQIIAEGSERQSFPQMSNPEAEQAKIDKENEGFWDKIQTGLDILGMIPVVGAVFDVVNAGISVARGDLVGAGMSLISMVPGVGDAFGAAKLAGKAANKIGKAVMKQGGDKVIQLGKSQMDKVLTAAKKADGPAVDIQKQVAEKLGKMQEQMAAKTQALLTAAAKNKGVQRSMKALNHRVLKKTKGTKGLSDKFCKWGFEPVDLITGRMMSEATDFEFPGPLPLAWSRRWISDSGHRGWLGHGVHHSFDMRLVVMEDGIGVLLGDGRSVAFELLHRGKVETFNRAERLTLRRMAGSYSLYDQESRLTYHFEAVSGSEKERAEADNKADLARSQSAVGAQHKGSIQEKNQVQPQFQSLANEDELPTVHVADKWYLLVRIETELEHRIELSYDRSGFLQQVTDSVGRVFEVSTDQAGRITVVTFVYRMNPSNALSEQREVLVSYAYNEAGDLSAVTDALGQTSTMEYDRHLMTKKTDRNGYSFHWRYDGPTTGARCVHTWGDDGLLEGRIAYFDSYNEVTNSLGHTSVYYYNPDFLCTKVTNPEGHSVTSVYSDTSDLLATTDEEGRVTQFGYDEQGHLVSEIQPDGNAWHFVYSEDGRLMQVTDPMGGSRKWQYDKLGRMKGSIGADQTATYFAYDERHRISEVRNPLGAMTKLEYDEQYNLIQVTLPDGTSGKWSYNHRGECLQATNPLGAKQSFVYDALGRVVRAKMPDGNVLKLRYDAYDDVVLAEDKQNRATFGYSPLGKLLWSERKGRRVELVYNNEEELTEVVNERGERYKLDRDAHGRVVREIGFDGIERNYLRSPSGLVNKVERPDGRWTDYTYDVMGRVTKTEYSDGLVETFGYSPIGELIETANPFAMLKFEYDQSGRVVKEWRDNYWIANSYDKLGNRTEMQSSLGAYLTMERDLMGQVSLMQAEQLGGKGSSSEVGAESSARAMTPWTAQMKYNALGQEIERLLPGGVISEWQYDTAGRPEQHRVSAGGRETRKRRYEWDVNKRLKSVLNELTGKKTQYLHDDFGNLIGASDHFSRVFRMADEVGNLYSSGHRTDREYGAGGRLLKFEGSSYDYDGEGNLIEKVEPNGTYWRYEYFGNGMMSKVVRPDGQEVTFKYDSIGRRIEKHFAGVINCYMWDGNNVLHEWKVTDQPADSLMEHSSEDKIDTIIIDDLERRQQSLADYLDNLITWVFKAGTFQPVAKMTADGTFSILTDYLGTPVEMFDEQGNIVWSNELDIYGKSQSFEIKSKRCACPFRYQGQYEDEETGLYYNRFRYYSPKEGMYTQQDPIRLSGGMRLYGYVNDPNVWVDPFGLNKNSCGTGQDGSRSFYTIQNSIDEARFRNGGEPWPTEPHKAHLGEGVYAWDNKTSAHNYLEIKTKRAPDAGLKMIEFSIAEKDLAKFKFFDVDGLGSDDAVNDWLNRYSKLTDGAPDHGYDYITRGTNFGKENFFDKSVMKYLKFK
ncbi:DUF6531 domain-containing protein [Paenibacillus sp. 481]|uniref:DUF6531 domain-containing protein n=1 Tax=Paenibacillus sp. 481 TaxID=2835869 RepID=UPI001E643CAB|nr:DUF6531 domain-containing protein [Paenibacillus sp. 481]UHA73171.1 RHS domain-containing protein [Paenibacillus sp. 481]